MSHSIHYYTNIDYSSCVVETLLLKDPHTHTGCTQKQVFILGVITFISRILCLSVLCRDPECFVSLCTTVSFPH